MKSLTCKQMAGACDHVISAETFDEAAEKSKAHGMEMMGDPAHQEVMQKMMGMSKEEQMNVFNEVKALWEAKGTDQ